MNHIRPSFLFSVLFRDVLFRVPSVDKTLYLTFDDGPVPGVTSLVLDMLKAHNAKASFFVCGKQVENNPELFRKIRTEGHITGNHTYHHSNGWKTAIRDYTADVEKAQALIQSRLFRPPYGKINLRQYHHLRKHYRIVVWDVMCMDFDQNITPETCFGNIRKYARPGSIIVFHDSEKAATNMLYALKQTLVVFGDEGYRFDRLPHHAFTFPSAQTVIEKGEHDSCTPSNGN